MTESSFIPISETEGESIPRDAIHWRREHYIPISQAELTRAISKALTRRDRRSFRGLCDLLNTVIHLEFRRDLHRIKSAYEFANPDKATLTPDDITDEDRARGAAELFGLLEKVLQRANFLQLSDEDVEQAIAAASDWGVRLNIDLGIFNRLEVYARGDIIGKRVRRRILNLYRKEVVDVPVYQRVAAVFRLRDQNVKKGDSAAHVVYLKLLKNVPKQDVNMILPGSQVRMSMLDRGKIVLPTLSGIAIALIKIFKGALLLAFAGFYGMVALLIFIAGTLAYGFKSFAGYRRIRDKYELNMTKSLYYQHLASNAGVLFRLIDEGEEQELREMILAYFLLWKSAGPDGWTHATLDERAEKLLRKISRLDVDFEVQDAMDKLRRFQLVEPTADGRWRAVDIAKAQRNARRALHEALLQGVEVSC